MNVVATVVAVSIIAVPVASVVAAFRFGPAKAAMMLLGLAVVAVAAPYIYFGVWSAVAGYEVWPALERVSAGSRSMLILVWAVMQWALAALVLGSMLSFFGAVFERK